MGLFDRFRGRASCDADTPTPRPPSRFARPEGEIAGPFPQEQSLQNAMHLRMKRACCYPFKDQPDSPLQASMWWVSIQPSFHAWAELGFVRTKRHNNLAGYRVGMVVGGCPEATATADFESLEEPRFEHPGVFWPRDGEGTMLDGCTYSLTMSHAGTMVSFHGCLDELDGWVRQFESTARLLQKETRNSVLGEYIDTWAQYIH